MNCTSCKKAVSKHDCVPCKPKPIKITSVKFVIDVVHCEELIPECTVDYIQLCPEKVPQKKEKEYCQPCIEEDKKDDFSDCISGDYESKQDCLSRAWMTTCAKNDCEDGASKAYSYKNF